jgi:D-amino-acid dehydrogenase
MHTVVLGGGVVGVTTAWYLRQSGHEVTVIDRQPGVGLETSFANAGMVSAGYSAPWAAPGVPVKALGWLFAHHAPLIFRPTLDLDQYRWIWKMLRECTSSRYLINKQRMLRLSNHSLDCLISLRHQLGIQYAHEQLGTLQLFRTDSELDAVSADVSLLNQLGVPVHVLTPAECAAAEPGLANISKFAGGIRLPLDETGDCYMFTAALAKHCEQHGVRFMYNTRVHSILTAGQRVRGCQIADLQGDTQQIQADNCVVALGTSSTKLLTPMGIRVPVYPVKGYSITVPVLDHDCAPRSTVMDEKYKVAVTRLSDRIRVGGMAELSGYTSQIRDSAISTLCMVLNDLFPDAADTTQPQMWSGLRPMTPDGTPVIGGTDIKGLYLNTGHGTLGWTMAAGSAQLLSDLINQNSTQIRSDDFCLSRYS